MIMVLNSAHGNRRRSVDQKILFVVLVCPAGSLVVLSFEAEIIYLLSYTTYMWFAWTAA